LIAARRALALAGLVIFSGGCALAGRTFSTYVDDALVRGSVKRRLSDEGMGRREGNVRVDTFDGTVYLSGSVETERQKSDAEIAAWQVPGVEQVVNDLVVRATADAPAAFPAIRVQHPLRDRLPGVARVEPGRPGGPDLAYDAQGRVIATVYVISSREVLDRDAETLRGEGRQIDHVDFVPLIGRAEIPVPHYAIILWHVSEPEAAALR
jgi:hypothetical protein